MTNRLLKKFLLLLVGALIVTLGISWFRVSSASTTFYYEPTDLGTLVGYESSYAYGLNDLGQVVGWSYNANRQGHAFLWQNSNNLTDLGTLPNKETSIAYAINNAGEVIGSSSSPGEFELAFSWKNSTIRQLSTLPGGQEGSAANDINNAGEIVGWAYTANVAHAVLWNDNNITDLGGLDNNASVGLGINEKGESVGYSNYITNNSLLNHAILWEKKNTITDLTPQALLSSSARRINKKGTVLIDAYPDYLLSKGEITELGNIDALDLNDKEKVVGYKFNSNFNPVAVLWEQGTITDLNDLLPPNSGWRLSTASAINNNGQIAGYGYHNGQERAFLLTPVRVTR
jgi:probable HAF family extracellular repeat protein